MSSHLALKHRYKVSVTNETHAGPISWFAGGCNFAGRMPKNNFLFADCVESEIVHELKFFFYVFMYLLKILVEVLNIFACV